jgi:hypothetical protein
MEKKRKLPILSIVRAGPAQFERFQIADDKNRLWTGQEFGTSGVLFAHHNQAAIEIQSILKGQFEGLEPDRYMVPLFVEVFSDEPVPVALVAQYLSRASKLYLNTPQYGNGPGSSLVLPWIEWHRIKEGGPSDE